MITFNLIREICNPNLLDKILLTSINNHRNSSKDNNNNFVYKMSQIWYNNHKNNRNNIFYILEF